MEIATKRSVEKNPADNEKTGFIDFVCMNDSLTIRIYGTILIKYDEFSKFETSKIKKAMEVLLDEKIRYDEKFGEYKGGHEE